MWSSGVQTWLIPSGQNSAQGGPRTHRSPHRSLGIPRNFRDFSGIFGIFGQILRFLIKITWFLSFSNKNDAESSINLVKIPFLDPKCVKLDQNSDFRHVRTCPGGQILTANQRKYFYFFQFLHLSILLVFFWFHKLRNTQGKIHGWQWNISRKYIWNI